jgi:hypothetical protein
MGFDAFPGVHDWFKVTWFKVTWLKGVPVPPQGC